MSSLSGTRALVTGATGFIGSRLVLRLLGEGAYVTATGRNQSELALLEQAGARICRAHLLDFAAHRQLMAGQDVVFHVAAWLGPRHGPSEDAWALNAYATEKVVRIAAASGVSRVVVVSSIAAYGPPKQTRMDEDQPVDVEQRAVYGRTKAQAELRARQAALDTGVDVVVVRPGMVYGPGSFGWSVRMVQFVKRGLPVVFGDGLGHAHPVYVDNLIDGLLLAAITPSASGQAFNFVDRPVSWRDWFGHYGDMCGRTPRSLPMWLARLSLRVAERLPLGLSVDRDLMRYYTNRSVYPTERARAQLEYQPQIDLQEGLARTEEWLRREGHL